MHIRAWHTVSFLAVGSFALVMAELPRATWPTSATLGLASGACALALMAAAAVLGGRWKFVEARFGGVDRVYLAHKWLGIWALAFASVHFLFKANAQGWETASIIALPAALTRLVRQLSFVGLMLIILLALNRNIPYRVWRWWHKLSGPLFLVVVLHWLSFKSPIVLASPAGTWLAALSALGVMAAGYKLLLYPWLSDHAEYRVVAVSPGSTAVHLQLMPVGRAIDFKPGQFAFLRMREQGLREPHPFTIASGNAEDGRVGFVIRDLGDFTSRLVARIAVGMHADIHAPFGRFKRLPDARREVWIGGGVGISPFIAWLDDASGADCRNVTLFYFHGPGRDFPKVEAIAELARQRGAELVAVDDGPTSPQFLQRFAAIASEAGGAAVDVSFCGPKGLLKAVRRQMRASGVPEARLRYEYFAFR